MQIKSNTRALLFIIVAEVLAINLRCNHSIHGIVIEDNDFKICQLADDTMRYSVTKVCIILAARFLHNFRFKTK